MTIIKQGKIRRAYGYVDSRLLAEEILKAKNEQAELAKAKAILEKRLGESQ